MSNPQVCLKAVQSAQECAGNVPCMQENIKVCRPCGNGMEGAEMCRSAPEYCKAGNVQGSGEC